MWGRDGQELFYLDDTETPTLMSVGTTLEPTFEVTRAPRQVLDFPTIENVIPPLVSVYDVSRDGQHFMAIRQRVRSEQPTSIVVVQNWFEELRRLVPTN